MKNAGIEKILVSQEQIEKRIKELATQLDKDYAGKKPLCICILKGSFLFFSDLVKKMNIPLFIDFISVSSHANGRVKYLKDLETNVKGKHVLLVEDILDSGNTLYALKKDMESRDAESVKVVTLLDKKARRDAPIFSDYVGFTVEDEFAVGYGLDYAGEYRNLPYIGCLGHTKL
ncbi:MAG: hypoxanthine phosphoribosyltransferase [Clostridia bacterium]|nr:hypoxanthine phosphoribosyltransferase [Clostridia bacterium]